MDDCANACQNREEWICNSFEYCFDSGYCVLSKLHPDERPGVVKNKALCDLYSSKFPFFPCSRVFCVVFVVFEKKLPSIFT